MDAKCDLFSEKNTALIVDGDQEAVLASDAFFPFSWSYAAEKACQAGVTAIVQPEGQHSRFRCVDCSNKYGVVRVFAASVSSNIDAPNTPVFSEKNEFSHSSSDA